MAVTRIEIDNGDINIENYTSSRCTVRIQDAGFGDKKEVMFSLTDEQSQDLYEALEVYIKSRTDKD